MTDVDLTGSGVVIKGGANSPPSRPRPEGRVGGQGERRHGRLFFGEGAERFSFVDLESERVVEAAHALRYGENPNFDLASALDDYRYLVIDCPTTELAQQRLALLRRAYRGTG